MIMFSYSGNAYVKKGEGLKLLHCYGDSSWVFELNSALFKMKFSFKILFQNRGIKIRFEIRLGLNKPSLRGYG